MTRLLLDYVFAEMTDGLHMIDEASPSGALLGVIVTVRGVNACNCSLELEAAELQRVSGSVDVAVAVCFIAPSTFTREGINQKHIAQVSPGRRYEEQMEVPVNVGSSRQLGRLA